MDNGSDVDEVVGGSTVKLSPALGTGLACTPHGLG
jgi:hypothetical protein